MKRILAAGAVVVAVACDTHNPENYVVAPSSTADIVKLSPEQTALEANGFASTAIKAVLPADAAPEKREVEFVTTAGQLAGAGTPTVASAGTALKVVAVPEKGEIVARVRLTSSTTIETAVIRAKALQFVAETRVDFTRPDTSTLLSLSAPASAPADGATLSEIRIGIHPELPPGKRAVKLVASKGRLSLDEVMIGTGEASAIVYLESPRETSPATVTATIEGMVTSRAAIQFVAAAPDAIDISRDKVTLKASQGETVTVEARLKRTVGKVTEGTTVTFRALDDSGRGVGSFFNVRPSNADGIATASWDPVDATLTGKIQITAVVGGLSATTDVTVVP